VVNGRGRAAPMEVRVMVRPLRFQVPIRPGVHRDDR
jgi:hypothetical protein